MHLDSLNDQLNKLNLKSNISCTEQLDSFLDLIFSSTYYSDRKMCLGGIMASDILTLPTSIHIEIKDFFTFIEDWLKALLVKGCKNGEFKSLVILGRGQIDFIIARRSFVIS